MKAGRLLLTLLLTAFAVLVPATQAVAAPPAQFTDVEGPYSESIQTLKHWGIVDGYPDGTFRPDNTLMRQQAAKMIVLAAGYAVTSGDVSTFRDTPPIDAANPLYPGAYVAVAARNGVILGHTDNTFRFFNNVTRAQLISMAVRAAGNALDEAPRGWQGIFNYSDPAHGQAIKAAEYNGWLAGIEDVYSWNVHSHATRGEAAHILAQLLGKVGNPAVGSSGSIRVGGLIDNPMGLTAGRLTNIGLVTLTVEHPRHGPTQYTGVRLSTVFALLGVQSGATEMTAVGSDGFTSTLKLSDIAAQPDSMLAVSDGDLNLVAPGQAGRAWVRDVASLEFR